MCFWTEIGLNLSYDLPSEKDSKRLENIENRKKVGIAKDNENSVEIKTEIKNERKNENGISGADEIMSYIKNEKNGENGSDDNRKNIVSDSKTKSAIYLDLDQINDDFDLNYCRLYYSKKYKTNPATISKYIKNTEIKAYPSNLQKPKTLDPNSFSDSYTNFITSIVPNFKSEKKENPVLIETKNSLKFAKSEILVYLLFTDTDTATGTKFIDRKKDSENVKVVGVKHENIRKIVKRSRSSVRVRHSKRNIIRWLIQHNCLIMQCTLIFLTSIKC